MNRTSVRLLAAAGLLSLSTAAAEARQFFYIAEGGVPQGVVFETYPTVNPNSSGATSAYAYSELAYFTPTGFTGTKRDQFEFWAGGTLGYTDPKGAPNSSGIGIADPEIGFEYYYNIIEPTAPVGSPGFVSLWTGPEVWLNFPNGNTTTAGYGTGADQYSFNISENSYLQIGKFIFDFNPIEVNYQFTNMNTTQSANDPSVFFKQRYGLSLTFGDVAIGYQVTPTLAVGIAQQFNANSIGDSTVAASREGFIGPTATYSGFKNFLVSAAVQTDYYHENTARNTYLAFWITHHF
jgi:hypothetical protein